MLSFSSDGEEGAILQGSYCRERGAQNATKQVRPSSKFAGGAGQ